jgi:hypothetical protein
VLTRLVTPGGGNKIADDFAYNQYLRDKNPSASSFHKYLISSQFEYVVSECAVACNPLSLIRLSDLAYLGEGTGNRSGITIAPDPNVRFRPKHAYVGIVQETFSGEKL